MRLYSTHKVLVGSVPNGSAFTVTFDETGHAEVEDEAVGNYLLQLHAASLAKPLENEPKDPPGDVTPDKMNVPQLKKFAKDNGIDIGEASKKEEILPQIQAFLEQKAKAGGTGDQQ